MSSWSGNQRGLQRMDMKKPDVCPACGSKKVARIQYGLPIFSEELDKQMKSGEVVLGGCCLTGDDPRWQCVDCGHAFGRLSEGNQARGQ